ncbi:MAG: bifunctional phosphopantothenoylcysteine decarboxylase/phosphopantothenate--cysteine ligase CoaBC [Dehalococcoidia bacterium]|nr:bifunctional phosphopantothenoylcysteine decarboxylase/phosphopantothenate--cysteine ligase CoaBC [Dehalococcoidia bacterium]
MTLSGKTIILGVTGSIAAYKAAELASRLVQREANVNTIMTEAAMRFISPLTFRSLTGRPVVTGMFDLNSEFSIEHVSLAEAADIVVIAPATANIIAKLASGLADDILCSTVLATKSSVLIAPAMNVNMYENRITQNNLSELKSRGFIVVGPDTGRLASGEAGPGRFAGISDITGSICQVLGRKGDLAHKHIVITAGGTQESIDPVRYISNRSSGKMGYALAEAARDRGAEVTLITAPSSLIKPYGVELYSINTAQEMYQAVRDIAPRAGALIMAAAVADYRPASVAKDKIKKANSSLTLNLVNTPDILDNVKGDFVRVGFAAESEHLVENARAKLQRKNLDLIIANDITAEGSGFGADNNEVVIIGRGDAKNKLPLLPKREVADKILDEVAALLP